MITADPAILWLPFCKRYLLVRPDFSDRRMERKNPGTAQQWGQCAGHVSHPISPLLLFCLAHAGCPDSAEGSRRPIHTDTGKARCIVVSPCALTWYAYGEVRPLRERPEIPKPVWHPPWKLMRVMCDTQLEAFAFLAFLRLVLCPAMGSGRFHPKVIVQR